MKKIFILIMMLGLSLAVSAQKPKTKTLIIKKEPMVKEAMANSSAAFRDAMDKLWEDHIMYTRLFIVDAAAGLPEKDAHVARLLQNQVDIGNAIKPYYGDAAGDQLTTLLKEHITTAADVVTAAKMNDKKKLDDANRAWFANADKIAAFLAKANPTNWPEASLRHHMHDHLQLTTDEAVAQLHGNWNDSIAAYDKVHTQILMMADVLADGIVKQFPEKFQ